MQSERDFIKSWKNAKSFVWKNKGWTSVKHNGNRTEWTPLRSLITRVINKIGRPRLTVLDDTKSRFQLIITVRNFRKKKRKRVHLGQNCGREHVQRKNFCSIWKFLSFFFRISSCCYGYCDQYCDWWIRLSGPNMVAITVRLQQTVRLRLNRMISEE